MYKLILSIIIIFFIIISFKYQSVNIKGSGFINLLKIKNTNEIIDKSTINDKIIDLRNIMPDNIGIRYYKNKGWGVYTMKDIKKNSIIYMCPYIFIEKPFDTKIISSIGEKYLDTSIIGNYKINNKYLFTLWDSFINHSFKPNSYYKYKEYYNDLKVYSILYANKNIKKNEELTINYIYLLNLFKLINLFFT